MLRRAVPNARVRWWIKRAVLAAIAIGMVSAATYGFLDLWVGYEIIAMFAHANSMYASAKNSRGDEVKAETNTMVQPFYTVIKLSPKDAWYSTRLIEVWSNAFSVGMKWRGDDTLELQLDFGLDADMSAPVTHVGPIHIVYRLGGKGTNAAPDIRPYMSCPPPYPSSFYLCHY